jgi:cbb3-type cytochrome oxidase subunit 3
MQHLKHTLESITGVEIYPLISLLIFFLFFIGLGAYVLSMSKQRVEDMSRKPLEDAVAVEKEKGAEK